MKIHSILPAFLFSGILALTSTLRAEGSLSKAPEVGQGTEQHREGRGEMLEKIVHALDLTDAQKAEIKPVIEEKRAQLATLRKNESLSRQEKAAEFKEIVQSLRQQLKGILTPAQQQKLEEIIAKIKEHRKEKQ